MLIVLQTALEDTANTHGSAADSDDVVKRGSSLDSKSSVGSATPASNTPSSSYKNWVTSSLKKSANLALKSNLSVKVKHMMYGKSSTKSDPLGMYALII